MITDLKNELSNAKQLTENGAVGYRTTGKELLDLNFMTSSLRNKSEDEIFDSFLRAFYEDKMLAIKWLFFMRDIRGGMGERRSFKVILSGLGHRHPTIAEKLISLVPEYGRWDDLFSLMGDDDEMTKIVANFIHQQLKEDYINYQNRKPISLLAKWLPKESTKKYKKVYKILLKEFDMKPKTYRQTVSELRRYLDVVEVKMSANKWDKVDYNTVPSKANLLYKDAFLKHDEERRKEYLDDLKNGNNAKINAKVLMPHEIVHGYMDKYGWLDVDDYDESLEQLWKALPDYINSEGFSMFVRDGSYSMTTRIGNTNITCLDVSTALAIYFSEHCKGEYKDNFITFSSIPKVIDLSNCSSLREKIEKCYAENDCSNTNIYEVFKLILATAVKNEYTQEQLPKNIVIVSDMEFDNATTTRDYKTLFETIQAEYLLHGYDLPRLVFWNLCSRTGAIPLKTNKNGVCLVSGMSPAIMDMVLSGELDPYKCLVDKLNSDRYKAVEDAIKSVIN